MIDSFCLYWKTSKNYLLWKRGFFGVEINNKKTEAKIIRKNYRFKALYKIKIFIKHNLNKKRKSSQNSIIMRKNETFMNKILAFAKNIKLNTILRL